MCGFNRTVAGPARAGCRAGEHGFRRAAADRLRRRTVWTQRLTPASPQANDPGSPRAVRASLAPIWRWASSTSCSGSTTCSSCSALSWSPPVIAPAVLGHHGLHRGAQHHARGGSARSGPRATRASRSGDCSLYRVRRGGDHPRCADGRPSLAARAPWLVAFAFGLLHGFGFAGALSEIGMPQGTSRSRCCSSISASRPDNLLFVAAVDGRRAVARICAPACRAGRARSRAYLIGSLAMFWVIQRVSVSEIDPGRRSWTNSLLMNGPAAWAPAVALRHLPASGRRNSSASDVGTLDKERRRKLSRPSAPYSPYAGRNFPTRPFFGDTHLHTALLDGRRRLRRPARAARRLSLRQGRGDHGVERPAGEALAPARFPRRRRSLGQHGLLPRPLRRQARAARRSDRPEVVRHDPGGQGRRGGDRDHHRRSPRATFPKELMYFARHAAATARPGGRPSRPPRKPTSPAASPPSSATSGRRTPAATTCTATSSSATTATRRSQVEPFTTIRRWAATIPRDLWKWMAAYEKKTGGDVLAIAHNGNLSNGRMFPIIESFTGKPLDREYAETRAQVGARSTKPRRSRATARRIRSSRPTTSSPTSSAGTRATSTSARRRRRRCSSSSTRARR